MSFDLKSLRGTISELFRDEKGGVVIFMIKGQAVRAMFFQNCVYINGKRVVKDPSIGQIKNFLKVGEEVEFDVIPNPKSVPTNPYHIRWKCSIVWKGQRPPTFQKLPNHQPGLAFSAPVPAAAPVKQAPRVSQPAQLTDLPIGVVVHAEGVEGVISLKRTDVAGEDYCRFPRKLCLEACYSDVVRFTYHRISMPVEVIGLTCIYDADSVIWAGNILDYDEDEFNMLTGVTEAARPSASTLRLLTSTPSFEDATGAWTQIESKKSKVTEKNQPAPPRQLTAPAARNSPPKEHNPDHMLFGRLGLVKEFFGWKAVIEFEHKGVKQRALLLSRKYDPSVETLVGLLKQGDLIRIDCHEYFRADGADNVTWFVAWGKKAPDTVKSSPRVSPPQVDPIVPLVGVAATVKVVDDVNHSGILELLAASRSGQNVYFQAECVSVDKRPVSRDLPFSAQLAVGDVVKVNIRPACESDPLDFSWVAEKVVRETRRFSAAVAGSKENEVNNNEPVTSTYNGLKIEDVLKGLDDGIVWDDEDDENNVDGDETKWNNNKDPKGRSTNGDHVQNPSPPVPSPPMPAVVEAQQASAQHVDLPPVSDSLSQGLKALMHSQSVQNQLIMTLLPDCPLETNMLAQAILNKLILGLLAVCPMETINSYMALMKTWMDLNPTLKFAVQEILAKRTTTAAPLQQTSVFHREPFGFGFESTQGAGLLNSSQNSSYWDHGAMDGPVNAGLASLMNSISSTPATRFGTYSPFEPARPGASASPLAATAGAFKNMSINGSFNPPILQRTTVTREVSIVDIIDENKGIAKFCDGGPYNGEVVEFTKEVCKFMGLSLPRTFVLSSVVRPGGRGICRAIRKDTLHGILWRAEELLLN